MNPSSSALIERWKYNPTFELWVSNMGHIRNKSKADIAPKVKNNGYLVVFVHGSLNKYMALHRVVMLTWRPTPEAEALTVDHLDHNKRNNALSNLEWVSESENQMRAAADFVAEKKQKIYKTNPDIIGIRITKDNEGIYDYFISRGDGKSMNAFVNKYKTKKEMLSIRELQSVSDKVYSKGTVVMLRGFEVVPIRRGE